MMNRIYDKHGIDAKNNLVHNLYHSIPTQHLKFINYANQGRSKEEQIAHTINYLNDPVKRTHMQGKFRELAIRHNKDPEAYVRHADRNIKAGFRHLRNAANIADHNWINKKIFSNDGRHFPVDQADADSSVFKTEDDLQKGAMQRLAPSQGRFDDNNVARWVEGEGWSYRENSPEVVGADRARMLHALTGKTRTRLNKEGKREFLLHRGMGPKEHAKATSENSNLVNHDKHSSWTPDYKIARDMANTYAEGGKPIVTSAWIPEKHIKNAPVYRRGTKYDNDEYAPQFKKEKEVIVAPGHNSEKVRPELADELEYKHLNGPRSIDEKINQRSKGDAANHFMKKKQLDSLAYHQAHMQHLKDDVIPELRAKDNPQIINRI